AMTPGRQLPLLEYLTVFPAKESNASAFLDTSQIIVAGLHHHAAPKSIRPLSQIVEELHYIWPLEKLAKYKERECFNE
ncbi:10221_t:CDS:2, partial [Paraglomus occultum]